MSKLFDFKDIKNKPSRNGFDLSRKVVFTSKQGMLLPIDWLEVMPGDDIRISVEHITRTSPVQTSAFVRLKEYFDFFFVPTRLMWKSFPSTITNMENNPVQAKSISSSVEISQEVPYVRSRDFLSSRFGTTISNRDNHQYEDDFFGFFRAQNFARLATYLGYGRTKSGSFTVKRDATGKVTSFQTFNDDSTEASMLNTPVNLFPLAAYHKIYNDYFRDSQWETATPYLWNFDYSNGGDITEDLFNALVDGEGLSDYGKGTTIFDLHYSNFNKDLMFGLLPSSQYGDVATVEVPLTNVPESITVDTNVVTTASPLLKVDIPSTTVAQGQDNSDNLLFGASSGTGEYSVTTSRSQTGLTGQRIVTFPAQGTIRTGQTIPSSGTVTLPESISASLSILALRQAEYLQKWKEIAQSGSQDYRDQIYKVFGVDLPQSLSDLCTYIGGVDGRIDISEVVNQSFTEENSSSPFIKGKGVGASGGKVSFEVKEHGYIMCIYHVQSLLDYDISGIDPMLMHTSFYDFANPVFDKIGMQEVPSSWFTSYYPYGYSGTGSDYTMGYAPRYVEYKSRLDRVLGDFQGTLQSWVAPITDEYLSQFIKLETPTVDDFSVELSYPFFKVNPRLLNNIFGADANDNWNTDQFLTNAYFDVKAVRPLDYNGLPY